ncbi:MalY/PatB family protein [Microbacterium sp. YY-01]|uniref:MalY/PatB family protein n=1 Tax=Microbacterium sp. YY-01 TaxID=3421634 RepID=UPI003D17FB10
MTLAEQFDAITVETLRERGSYKWTAYPNSIGMFVAEMDFGTAPVVDRALRTALDNNQFGYISAPIARELSRATADYQQRRFGWSIAPQRVHPIADVLRGLEVVIEHFSAPGTPVIVPTPGYMPFLTVPGQVGRAFIEVPLLNTGGRYEFDLDAIDAALAQHPGALVVLCNPYNPTGRVLTTQELLAFSEVVERRGGRVFADEIHAPLVYEGHLHVPYASVSEAAAAHSVTAVSASKAWNFPGLKCAQLVITNDADAQIWSEVKGRLNHGPSTIGMIANTAAYDHGQPWLDEVTEYLQGNWQLMQSFAAEHMPALRVTQPEGTYIGWLDWRGYDLGDTPATLLREKAGVALTAGTSCGQAGAGFTRIIFATPRPILQNALEQLADAVSGCRTA